LRATALLIVLLDVALGWTPAAPLALRRAPVAPSHSPPLMMAKSKKPSRKKKKEAKPYEPAIAQPYEPAAASYTESPSGLPVIETSSAAAPDAPVEDRVAAVLREAGLASDSGVMAGGAQASTDPLSRIPKAGQELLERFFAGGALTFGSIFLVSGISVSVEALCKVLGYPLPVAIDEVLVQYVEPALTPSILILFGFSISLGLLKQLQLGSESAGVLYSEDED